MPLAIGPQAVVCAPSRAACSLGPTAAAQFERPRNSMHTRHCTLARAVVMKKNNAATANTTAMLYSVERFTGRPPAGWFQARTRPLRVNDTAANRCDRVGIVAPTPYSGPKY